MSNLKYQVRRESWQALTKVPKIAGSFWLIKLMTTAMGEATSDFLVGKFNPYLAVLIGFIAFVSALVLQFSTKKYVTWIYWLAAAMVSVFGTMAADVLHKQFGVPYILSTLFYGVLLVVIFSLWQKSEGTLSIHSIYTRNRELFYWAVVVTTFALGTATGDLTAITFNLGYFGSAIMFSVIFLLPAIGYWLFRLNAIFAFWFAYVITRPVGASFADWLGKPKTSGGLGYGDGLVALVLSVIIIILVGYTQIAGKDHQTRHANL